MPDINFYNIDNIEFMREKPDNYYDLAIVDPPYGIGADVKNNTDKKQSKKSASNSKKYGNQFWEFYPELTGIWEKDKYTINDIKDNK